MNYFIKIKSVFFIFLIATLLLQGGLRAEDVSEYRTALLQERGRESSASSSDITISDYCSFLNEVVEQAVGSEKTMNYGDGSFDAMAASNLNDLYDERTLGVLIMRTGLPGSYCYNLISKASANSFNSCITGLSWNDAEQYCNWRNNAASTSTYNLNSCGYDAAHVDRSLKSNQLTFRLVNTGATVYQAGGEEAGLTGLEEMVESLEAIAATVLGSEGTSRRPLESARERSLNQRELSRPVAITRTTRSNSEGDLQPGMSIGNESNPLRRIRSMIGRIWPRCNLVGLRQRSLREQSSFTSSAEMGAADSSEKGLEETKQENIPQKKKKSRGASVTFAGPDVAYLRPIDLEAIHDRESDFHSISHEALPNLPGEKFTPLTLLAPLKGEAFPYQDELTALTLHFAQIRNHLIKPLKSLAKTNDPEKPVKAAAMHAEAYPLVRRFLQSTFSWVQEHPELQNEFAAKFLADATIKLIGMASKTVAPGELSPFKVINPFFEYPKRLFSLRFQVIPYSLETIQAIISEELEEGIIAQTAVDSIFNLKEMVAVLKQPPDQVGKSLHENQVKRAERTRIIADQKSLKIHTIKIIPAKDEEANSIFWYTSIAESQRIRKCIAIVDATEARKETIADIIKLIQPGLDTADHLVRMLTQRKKVN